MNTKVRKSIRACKVALQGVEHKAANINFLSHPDKKTRNRAFKRLQNSGAIQSLTAAQIAATPDDIQKKIKNAKKV